MRSRLLAAALASALLVTGCGTVPTKGPIRSGSQDGPAPLAGGIGVEAQPPRQNAAPLTIVNGFLEAMSDKRGLDKARQYMTPPAAASWKPEQRTYVYDQSSTKAVSIRSQNSIALRAPLIGSIDGRGSWTPAPRGALASFDFVLAKVDGQYRVASVPPGVFLGSNLLDARLRPSPLYFANRERDMLVPDTIYLPNNLPPGQAATQLVQELLKGPTDRLGNGVVTAAPPGTQVNVSVPVDYGVATVALSDTANGLSTADRQLLAAQIAWTLRPISSRVRITVGGAQLLPDLEEVLTFSDFSQYDPSVPIGQMKDLYGVRNHKLVRINQDGSNTIDATPLDGSQLYQFKVQSFAVDLRGEFGAVVTEVNSNRVIAYGRLEPGDKDGKPEFIPTDGTVLRPTFDNVGNLWIVDRAGGDSPRLRMRNKDGKVTEIQADFQGQPIQLRMAPDGVRALLVISPKTGGGNVVKTATVVTDDQKLALSNFRSLELPLVDITDASWTQSGILVAGKARIGAPRQPWQVNVDGSQPRLIQGASNDFQATFLASNTNIDTLPVVEDPDGRLHWQTKDLGWATLDDNPAIPISPVYPG
ncbi:sporulation and spore germination protein [Kribbella sp. VKM Ac-2527]|uniref:Sporulation and spore germination protein n=1 Tax=Kribbella caucasensis TaxID=2512215 RepID=A0A4R6KMS3_9ACTN|nr:LpqB family beta-propeller domain-containing protein [Kribbella sp. VKM Ac-2527]TDO51360.1 sporulation and spore germination protein [Kribbella sp. VKM Ac-2527]